MAAALLPDPLWNLIEPFLPIPSRRPQGGRPRVSDRARLTGILFVLRSGVHKTCVEDGACPKCGRPFLPTEAVHARPSALLQTELDRPRSITVMGRLAFVGVPIGAVFAISGLALTSTDVLIGIATIFAGLLAAGFSVALGYRFLKGHDWARRFIVWGTPLLMATDFVFGSNRLLQPGFSVWLFVLQGMVYCIYLFFLNRPDARAFFGSRQARDEPMRANPQMEPTRR